MTRITIILTALSLILAGSVLGILASHPQKTQLFGGYNSVSLLNKTSTLTAAGINCGATTTVVVGPFAGNSYLRATNDATSSIYLAIAANTSTPLLVHTGITLAAASSGGMYYWDTGESNINLPDGSYLTCVANTSGSALTYFMAR